MIISYGLTPIATKSIVTRRTDTFTINWITVTFAITITG